MRNPRTLVRIVASTLTTAGLVLGMAGVSNAAVKPARDSGWAQINSTHMSPSKDSGWHVSAMRDSGW